MRGEFRHQPVGNGLQALILLRLLDGSDLNGRAIVVDLSCDGPRLLAIAGQFAGGAVRLRLDRQLVLRPDEPALDPQTAARRRCSRRRRRAPISSTSNRTGR